MLSTRKRIFLKLLPVALFILGAVAIFAAAVLRGGEAAQAMQPPQENAPLPSATSRSETDPAATVELPPYSTSEKPYANGINRDILLHTTIPSRPRVDVSTYVVQSGDNLFSIAERFGLKPETVLWGNYDILRDNPQFLRPDQELNILPVDGTYYQWAAGDSLSGVASFFGVAPENIEEYPGNQLDTFAAGGDSQEIEVGAWLIVPGGQRELRDWGPPAITRANPASAAYYGSGSCGQIYEGAVGTNTFLWPTVSRTISGYDYNPGIHPGLDIAGPEGNAVYAVDSGVVVYSGWSEYGYGNLIVLDHGTGWQSAYAHLAGVGVTCGQSVAQGTVIGTVGNTGNSTGPHLHFELRSEIYGKVNPWNYLIP